MSGGGRVHVLGGGLAGLAAAGLLLRMGRPVTVYEAAPHPGGRARSLWDPRLGLSIDTGPHLMLSGNRAVRAHAQRLGTAHQLAMAPTAAFAFRDHATGRGWTLRPNRGPLPWWVLAPGRRVPGAGTLAHVGLWRLLRARSGTVADAWGGSTDTPLWRRLVAPLTLAVLNTPPEEAAAAPLAAVLAETFARGAGAMRPLLARHGLGPALIDPAVADVQRRGGRLRLACPVRALEADPHTGRRVATLHLRHGERVTVAEDEAVLSALPFTAAPRVLGPWLPELAAPWQGSPILNLHVALPAPPAAGSDGSDGFLGLVGGPGDWVFRRGRSLAVTVGACAGGVSVPALWAEAAAALGLAPGFGGSPLPPHRVIVAQAATLRHTPAQESRRPGPRTRLANLVLAGDWTATGLPCTLEGACRSAEAAVAALARPH